MCAAPIPLRRGGRHSLREKYAVLGEVSVGQSWNPGEVIHSSPYACGLFLNFMGSLSTGRIPVSLPFFSDALTHSEE